MTRGPDKASSRQLDTALRQVRSSIAEAALRSGRRAEEVTLVAASKGVPAAAIRLATQMGVDDLAENYANELARKAGELQARWHFIGRLQSGTAATVARFAHIVHSAVPGGALTALAGRCARAGRTLECLVQVDFTGRRQGIAPGEVRAFLESAQNLAGIRLVGLMTLPPLTPNPEGARPYFARLRDMRDDLAGAWPGAGELSMGMSSDYEIAVEEGATMVRVGTALFGPRAPVGGRRGSPVPAGAPVEGERHGGGMEEDVAVPGSGGGRRPRGPG